MRRFALLAVLGAAACATTANPWPAAFVSEETAAPSPASRTAAVEVRYGHDPFDDEPALRERGYVRVGTATVKGPRRDGDRRSLEDQARAVNASVVLVYPEFRRHTLTSGSVRTGTGPVSMESHYTVLPPCIDHNIPMNNNDYTPCQVSNQIPAISSTKDAGSGGTHDVNVVTSQTATFWRRAER